MELPVHLVVPLAALMLCLLSFAVRWLGHFSLSDVGSDLSLVAVAIRLASVSGKLVQNVPGSDIVVDFLMFLGCVAMWAITLKVVQKSKEKEAGGALLVSRIYFAIAVFIGVILVTSQIVVRL